jgi:hypothetical protein
LRPDLWRGAELLREADGRRHVEQLRRMKLPPEALLLRRMEGLLFQTATTLRATTLAAGPRRGVRFHQMAETSYFDERSLMRVVHREQVVALSGARAAHASGPSRRLRGYACSGHRDVATAPWVREQSDQDYPSGDRPAAPGA